MNAFINDPNTETDDKIALLAAQNDRDSTRAGAIVAIIGTIAPILVSIAPWVQVEVKLAFCAGGAITSGAGAAIARHSPFKVSRISQN